MTLADTSMLAPPKSEAIRDAGLVPALPSLRSSCWSPGNGGSALVTLRKLLQRVPGTPFDVNRLCFLEYAGIPSPSGVPASDRDGAAVRGATPEDLEGITGCQYTPQAFVKRFRARDYCVVAAVGKRIVGYQWFCAHPVHVEERYAYRIALPPDTIYTYDAFILPEYRLTGIWVRFHLLYLRELMQRLGRTRVLTMVDHGNRLSLNTHLRFGYRPLYAVVVAKVAGKSFFLTTSFRQRPDTRPQPMSYAPATKELVK